MYPYAYIPVSNRFRTNGMGFPQIYKKLFTVPLTANVLEYPLAEKSLIEDRYVVGIWLQPSQYNSAAVDPAQSGQIPAAAVMNTGVLKLQKDQTIIAEIPFVDILRANDNGMPYFVSIDKIQMSDSKIVIYGNSSINANDYVAFTFDFLIPVKDPNTI